MIDVTDIELNDDELGLVAGGFTSQCGNTGWRARVEQVVTALGWFVPGGARCVDQHPE